MNDFKFSKGDRVKYCKEITPFLKSKNFNTNKIYIIKDRFKEEGIYGSKGNYYILNIDEMICFSENSLCKTKNKVKKL